MKWGGGKPKSLGATGDEDSLVPDTSNREESLRSSEEAGGIGEDGAEYGKLSSLSNTNREDPGRISRDWRWRRSGSE